MFGASSGIGRATALRLASCGARVTVSARNEDGLTSLVAEIRQLGDDAIAVPAEVTDFAQVSAEAERAVKQLGRRDT